MALIVSTKINSPKNIILSMFVDAEKQFVTTILGRYSTMAHKPLLQGNKVKEL